MRTWAPESMPRGAPHPISCSPRQVDILEVEDDARVIGRPQALAGVGGHGLAAHLRIMSHTIRQ